jgi:hypothetical protein
MDLIAGLLQELAAAIAFRISQTLPFTAGPKASVALQFLVFVLIVIPLFLALVIGSIWLLIWLGLLFLR